MEDYLSIYLSIISMCMYLASRAAPEDPSKGQQLGDQGGARANRESATVPERSAWVGRSLPLSSPVPDFPAPTHEPPGQVGTPESAGPCPPGRPTAS